LTEPVPIKVGANGVLTVPPFSTLMVPALPAPITSDPEVNDPPVLTFNVPGPDDPTSIAEEALAPSAMVTVPIPPPPLNIFKLLSQVEPAPVTLTVPVLP